MTEYDYCDEQGNCLYQCVRNGNGKNKRIYYRRKDKAGNWVNNLFGVDRVLYGLPELKEAGPSEPIYVVEGEKCADALFDLDIPSTTSGGSTSTDKVSWEPLRGRKVILWPDNDTPGMKYADAVTDRLQKLGCTVEIIDIEELNLPDGGDVVDWLEQNPNATRREIEALLTHEPEPTGNTVPLSKTILSCDELLKADIPERKKILPWLPEGGLVMVAASRGLGKTFYGISLACSVASGKSFMKWDVSEPVGVLYIDGEMPLVDYRTRLVNFNHLTLIKPLLTLSHENYYSLREGDMDITDDNMQDEILSYLDEMPDIKLIIIDNLSCLTRIREDKSDDWLRKFLPFLIACRRRRVAVLFMHHTNKSDKQRGTGSREDHLDTSIMLKKASDEYKDGAFFQVEFTKSRGFYDEDREPFTAKLITNDNNEFEWEITDVDKNIKSRLIKLVKGRNVDGVTNKEAADELGVTPGAISKAKNQLFEEDLIKMNGKRMIWNVRNKLR